MRRLITIAVVTLLVTIMGLTAMATSTKQKNAKLGTSCNKNHNPVGTMKDTDGMCKAVGETENTLCGDGVCTVQKVAKSNKVTAKRVISSVCPVMGSRIQDVTKAAGKTVYKGKTYYFCCAGCKPKFDAHPDRYTKKK